MFDLGGGTFDVSVLELGEGVFEVKSTNGDTHLGGDNWDKAIVDWIVAEFRGEGRRSEQGPLGPAAAVRGCREGEGGALFGHRDHHQPAVHHHGPSGPLHLEMILTRAKLEELTRDLLERVVAPPGRP